MLTAIKLFTCVLLLLLLDIPTANGGSASDCVESFFQINITKIQKVPTISKTKAAFYTNTNNFFDKNKGVGKLHVENVDSDGSDSGNDRGDDSGDSPSAKKKGNAEKGSYNEKGNIGHAVEPGFSKNLSTQRYYGLLIYTPNETANSLGIIENDCNELIFDGTKNILPSKVVFDSNSDNSDPVGDDVANNANYTNLDVMSIITEWKFHNPNKVFRSFHNIATLKLVGLKLYTLPR